MSTKWIVLFDSSGLDMLVPCDEIRTKEMLEWLGGKPHESELQRHAMIAKMRAMVNPQRFPEVWVYDCEEDYSLEDMRDLWEVSPQRMADLVRKKGSCLYKTPRERSVIT